MGRLPHVITYAKCQVEIFRGYDFTGGQISHFPIDFWMGLTTVQRDCAACDEDKSNYAEILDETSAMKHGDDPKSKKPKSIKSISIKQ